MFGLTVHDGNDHEASVMFLCARRRPGLVRFIVHESPHNQPQSEPQAAWK